MKTLRILKTPNVLSSSRPIQFRIEISSSEYFMYFMCAAANVSSQLWNNSNIQISNELWFIVRASVWPVSPYKM